MAQEKAPAFQFYPKEFLTDGNVAGMSLQERGAYITLICLCWQEGTLPVERSRLANMVGLEPRFFTKLWVHIKPCFREIAGGRLVHPRLEKEREKQAEYRRRQSDKGKLGAASRWPGDGTGIAAAMAQAIPDDGSPISDLQTAVNKNPLPPKGGRVTRADRKHAKEVRRQRFGRCHHEPECRDGAACESVIAQETANRRMAS